MGNLISRERKLVILGPSTDVGACCILDDCTEGLTEQQCHDQGGSFLGLGTNCDPNPCSPDCDLGLCSNTACNFCGCPTSFLARFVVSGQITCIPGGPLRAFFLDVQMIMTRPGPDNPNPFTCVWSDPGTPPPQIVECLDLGPCNLPGLQASIWLIGSSLSCLGECNGNPPPPGLGWTASAQFAVILDCDQPPVPGQNTSVVVEGCWSRNGCPQLGSAPYLDSEIVFGTQDPDFANVITESVTIL